jgi:hypothetical protein
VQIELLMALAAFIDIEESIHPINIEIFPKDVVYYLNFLIGNNLLQLSPHSSMGREIADL